VVKGATKEFPGPRRHSTVKAVSGVSLSLPRSQTFGLVGESGSGKTTLARIVAGLTPPTSGTLEFDSQELRPTVGRRQREVLRRLQMVFQNPDGSLNPRLTVREALVRPLVRLAGLDRLAAAEAAADLLRAVRLPAAHLDRYPGELSGGEKQRVAIARAFAAGPDLVLCDEPLSSLDVSVQGALMNLLIDLQRDEETSYLFISHDIPTPKPSWPPSPTRPRRSSPSGFALKEPRTAMTARRGARSTRAVPGLSERSACARSHPGEGPPARNSPTARLRGCLARIRRPRSGGPGRLTRSAVTYPMSN
jgi:ABC-type dipeptide/oligopeptide/nickel transport system ATPase subunit